MNSGVIKIEESIYRSTVYVFIGTDEAFIAWLKRRHHHELDVHRINSGRAVSWFDDLQFWFAAIRLPYWGLSPEWEAGQLAHEALHVTEHLAKPRGLKGEAKNYYLQWLIEEATAALNVKMSHRSRRTAWKKSGTSSKRKRGARKQ